MHASTLLVVASLALLIGPLCGLWGERSRAIRQFVDGFALVVITGVCLLVVLPHVLGEIGWYGLLVTSAGAFVPMLFHRREQGSRSSLMLVALALTAHVLLDGAILATQRAGELFAWAVIAHRLPVGFAIVVAAKPMRRPLWAAGGIAVGMIAATVLGFVAGPGLVTALPEAAVVGLEAFVAGLLLHVIFVPHGNSGAEHCSEHAHMPHAHHPHHASAHADHADHAHDEPAHAHEHDHGHDASAHGPHGDHAHAHDHGHDESTHAHSHGHGHHHDHSHEVGDARERVSATAGFLLGLGAIAAALHVGHGSAGHGSAGHGATEQHVDAFVQTLGVLIVESAPALMLGYALAGVIPFLLTASRTSALGRGGKLMQALRGVAFGLPLPVCSCGVLPLYESLIRKGAPAAAAMAFFVATPELGLDAVLLSVPLLGSSLTLARVVTAFVVAVIVGLLMAKRSQSVSIPPSSAEELPSDAPWPRRMRAGLRFGFVDVFDHTMPWIALGLMIAAASEPMLSHGFIGTIPRVVQVPLAALIGVPVYVCASGATPVAALAIHKGLSTGAAVAFLIAGPATNVTTFGVLARLHGRRTAVVFGLSVTGLAILAGWTVDALGVVAAPVLDAHAELGSRASWFAWLNVAGLGVLTIASLVRQGPRGMLRQILEPIHTH